MHLTQIGIEVHSDGGKLFYLALTIFLLASITLYDQRRNIPVLGAKL
jgi:hypothetical protein